MKRKLMLLVAAFIMAIVVAACGSQGNSNTDNLPANSSNGQGTQTPAPETKNEKLTIEHQLGKTEVAKNPQKIVVFDFGALDTLDKMGIEVTGVPQANIPPYLSKYEDKKYSNVGSLKEPDFEKISEISPDLIIISGRQSDSYEELSKLGPTIYIGVDTAKYMESFTENMKTLGTIFGKETFIEEELAKVNQVIGNVKEKVAANSKNALIILANDGAISAYGPGSRFGIIHDVLGFTPVDDSIKVTTHGDSISFEFIVEKNPDYLFVVDRGAAVGGESSAQKAIENELIKNTNAYKNGTIVYLDPNYWYLSGGGLISVAGMVQEIEQSLK